MEVVAIFALVLLAYVVLQRQTTGTGNILQPTTQSSAALAAELNRNQRAANFQLTGIIGSGAQPDTGLQLAQVGTGAGLQVGQSFASSAAEGGSTTGSAISTAIPIVGSVLAVGFGFLAAHTARVKGAQQENEGINAMVPAFDLDLKEIHDAYLAGQINATMAVSYLNQVHDQYWQYMSQFQGRPGVRSRPCPPGQIGAPGSQQNGCTTGQPKCDNGCTAGCCVGCAFINASITNCIWAIQNQYHGPISICHIFGSKYGANDRPGYLMYW